MTSKSFNKSLNFTIFNRNVFRGNNPQIESFFLWNSNEEWWINHKPRANLYKLKSEMREREFMLRIIESLLMMAIISVRIVSNKLHGCDEHIRILNVFFFFLFAYMTQYNRLFYLSFGNIVDCDLCHMPWSNVRSMLNYLVEIFNQIFLIYFNNF